MISEQLELIADTILVVHRELFEESPTPMKLQKLCYYAQGYSLAEGSELFSEDFQAWQHGPVLYPLYAKFKSFQWRQISNEVEKISEEHKEFLTDIVAAYGRYDGAALSTMTHRESPWVDARGGLDESEGSKAVITKDSLAEFFQFQLKAYE